MESFSDFASATDSSIWSPYLLVPAPIGTGIILTIRLGAVHLAKFGPVLHLRLINRNDGDTERDITNHQAFVTALAATVGVGNIADVITAIGLGGSGALSWVWVTGLLSMTSKYSEAFLGVKYRQVDAADEQSGSPQYYLRKAILNGFGRTLDILFAALVALIVSSIGNPTQGNTVVSNLKNSFNIEPTLSGIIVLIPVDIALMGGVKSTGHITASFMPMMIIFYIGTAVWVLVANVSALPEASEPTFTDASTDTAAVGEFAGSMLILALQMGVARGLFSNESSLGSGAIVAAAASTTCSTCQGLVSMTQTFIDTIIVVSFTGLVIINTGVWQGGNVDTGALVAEVLSRGLPGHWGGTIVTLLVAFFTFSIMLGWSRYGERAFESLVSRRGTGFYHAVPTCVVFVRAVIHLETVRSVASAPNGLMALSSPIDLVVLSGLIAYKTKAYLRFDPQLRATVAEINKW